MSPNTPKVKPRRRGLSRRAWLRLLIYGSPLIVLGYGRFVEPRRLKFRRLRVGEGRLGARFVHITDLHHRGQAAFLRRVVKRINALRPDFVCFTGDIMEDTQYLPGALAGMGEIRAPLYGVPGNHDYWAGADFGVVAKAFAATGGRWLMDETVAVAAGKVRLTGVTCRKPQAAQPMPGAFNVLLMHYPAWVDHVAPRKFELILAGHSHGGQVRLPWLGALVKPYGVEGYELGWYQTAAGPLYVNPGLGYFYLNVRFNCPPEVTLFEV